MGGLGAGGGLWLGPLALGSAGRLSLPQRAVGEGPASPALILKPVEPTDQLVLAMPRLRRRGLQQGREALTGISRLGLGFGPLPGPRLLISFLCPMTVLQ